MVETDVLTGFALDFIKRRAASEKPFFLDVSYLASHFEFKPGTVDKANRWSQREAV